MRSQPGKQTIAIHVGKVKATGQYNLVRQYSLKRQIFFFKKHAENAARRLVLDLFLLFKKALYEVICYLANLLFAMR